MANKPNKSCVWPLCLSDTDADILAQECLASLMGMDILVTQPYDQTGECNCDGES